MSDTKGTEWKCGEATKKFIEAVAREGKEGDFGEITLEGINYDFVYRKGNGVPADESVEIIEHEDHGLPAVYKIKSFTVSSENDAVSIWDIICNYGLDFRVCDECGKPMEDGYYNEDVEFCACSDDCFKKQMDEAYDRVWRKTEDEREGKYYEAYDVDTKTWEDVNAYYTEWY